MSTLNLKISEDPDRAPWAVDLETMRVTIEGDDVAQLIGFSKTDEAPNVDLSIHEWAIDPTKADGMHPVFRSSAGEGVLSIPVLATIREGQAK